MRIYKLKPFNILFLAAFVLSIHFSGCSHQKTEQDANALLQKSGESFGPDAPAPGTTPPPAPQTVSIDENFKGYVLLFGPALARSGAYAGVLRSLESQNVKIVSVSGVEFGALVASIWTSANSNILEWEFFKLKRDDLMDYPMLGFKRTAAEGKRIMEFAQKAIKSENLEKTSIPTVIISTQIKDDGSTELLFEKSGNAASVIRGALGIPGLIKPFYWENKLRVSAGLENPFPVDELKTYLTSEASLYFRTKEEKDSPSDKEYVKILCIDGITSPNNPDNKDSPIYSDETRVAGLMRAAGALSKQQLKSCDESITIDLKNMGFMDFSNQAELIFRGKQAVERWLKK